MQIASVTEEEWTEEERERFETFDNKLSKLLAETEALLEKENEK
jgi:hypothetical protein